MSVFSWARAAGPLWAGVLLAGFCSVPALAADWTGPLKAEIERIDRETPGQLGVYVKELATGKSLSHQADRAWYLGSSVKAPIAVALLQEVQAGRRSLAEKLVLQPTDKVDGSGPTVWQKDGSSFATGVLLERMLMQSDNTASNMLVRSIGLDRVNQRAQQMLGNDGVVLTDFTEIRYLVYAALHPDARRLSNLQLVQLAAEPPGPRRVANLRRLLSLEPGDLKVPTIEQAYAGYYARQLNTASLVAYGGMLEKLVRGELLSPQHTQLMFKHMKFDTYDAYRLEAGLPRTVRFIHKTGTQLGRACHMGVIEPQDGGRNAIVVAACAQDLDEQREAGRAFERIGRAITASLLTEAKPRP